jgi:hypothetical protein
MKPKSRGLAQHGGPLAGWRRVTQQGVILYVMDGPCRLPWRTIPRASVWDWSISKCTQNTVRIFVTQGRHSLLLYTVVDPFLLTGTNSHFSLFQGKSSGRTICRRPQICLSMVKLSLTLEAASEDIGQDAEGPDMSVWHTSITAVLAKANNAILILNLRCANFRRQHVEFTFLLYEIIYMIWVRH